MIYLDANATQALRPVAFEAMRRWWGVPSNASSVHAYGQRAAVALEQAREAVAALVGGRPEGVTFTSGATEANQLGLLGAYAKVGGPVVSSSVEHPCVRGALAELAARGASVRVLGVGPGLQPTLEGEAGLVAVMAANHETGVIHELERVRAAWPQAWLHVDAAQAAGRVLLGDVQAQSWVLSAHKLGGPQGIGALVLQDGTEFPPLVPGGAQERGRRPGTVPLALAVGFAAAAAEALAEREARLGRWRALMARLEAGLIALGGEIVGQGLPRLAQTVCVVFGERQAETLVMALDLRGFCASAGAACASGSLAPSPVLLAMGHANPRGGLRFSFGPETTELEVEALLAALPEVLVLADALDGA